MRVHIFAILAFFSYTYTALYELERLKQAYPHHIKSVHNEYITWIDGTRMPIGAQQKTAYCRLNKPSLADQIIECYPTGKPNNPQY